ncbi:phenylalanine--tRNA ligase subunit beta [Actinomadura citrea]|uniref:Phenylalanine--tRNA ligase beta subunit n=1 Tax=Actinomadura citrea TaxID=46158 RepID=A0A7Y9GBH9_9ACTN|nr:phenylalanine--tRNA ligase subunit beta [Actinomadura citrea]NYE13485.1 phenylalanyl-tRNA synthetase beta chain [Actinomadura citrea]GGU10533.1 phenylalanine--tRNA ligase beta subunit [Actinomadura citrea]
MRAPLSWLREHAELPADVTGRALAAELIAAGLEVETVERAGADIAGPLVVGEVLAIEELTGFKKPIRHCRVDVGDANGTGEPQSIVCGATNFAVGDRVVVVLPGGVLPGGFEIGARKTYGRLSEGMICSVTELGIGDDHSGILVLPPDTPVGADAIELLGLRDDVLDIAVTPDRGYALSIRGIAREAAIAYGVPFRDPAEVELPSGEGRAPEGGGESYPASIGDPSVCDRFVLREVSGFDPDARTPMWMQVRLHRAGMRPVSLAVDITNYLMLELGQPLHAFDRGKLTGPIVVRRAEPGEQLETLDHVKRTLDPEDILITDASGPISMAGTMGGLATEIDDRSSDMVVEAAHFDAMGTARMSRRHRLHSEASHRFERGVDRELPLYASYRAVRMLAELGGAKIVPGVTHAEAPVERAAVTMPAGHPDRVAGVAYGRDVVVRRLEQVGCTVAGDDVLTVTPPSWRPDLTAPNDLAEEVIRLEGYEDIPARAPRPAAGKGLTAEQRLRRRVGRALAGAGYVEALAFPFVAEKDLDGLQLPAGDARRRTLRLANPMSEEEPLLRTTLLPGLLKVLALNVGRGFGDVALFEVGVVFRPRPDAPERAPRLAVDRGPTAEEVAGLEAALPDQPYRVAVVLSGDREPSGWWGEGRPALWADAVEAARTVAREVGVELAVKADQHEPWHPGRCAALYAGDTLVGHAGELHPRVTKAYGLPARSCAMELELRRLGEPVTVRAPHVSSYPVAMQDVALVVDSGVPAAEVESALRDGAGGLLEAIRLFDVYTGEQVGEGRKSLAYSLRFRAPDRTLTAEEASQARDSAVAAASERTGAVLRGA